MLRKLVLVAVVGLAAFAAPALAVGKGSSMFAIQLGSGTADLYDPSSAATSGYISAYDHSEMGVRGQFWKMMSEDYAFTVAGGIGFFSEENEPGTAASPGDPTTKYTQSSFHVRVGGDRVVSVGERATLYFGPGVEFWSGKAEFDAGTSTLESEGVTRISLAGRMGAIMTMGSNWGLHGEIEHKMGRASAEDTGAKASWWPSSVGGNGGIIFMFGGN